RSARAVDPDRGRVLRRRIFGRCCEPDRNRRRSYPVHCDSLLAGRFVRAGISQVGSLIPKQTEGTKSNVNLGRSQSELGRATFGLRGFLSLASYPTFCEQTSVALLLDGQGSS